MPALQNFTGNKLPLYYFIGYWPFFALQKVSISIKGGLVFSELIVLVVSTFCLRYNGNASETFHPRLRCENSFLKLGTIISSMSDMRRKINSHKKNFGTLKLILIKCVAKFASS